MRFILPVLVFASLAHMACADSPGELAVDSNDGANSADELGPDPSDGTNMASDDYVAPGDTFTDSSSAADAVPDLADIAVSNPCDPDTTSALLWPNNATLRAGNVGPNSAGFTWPNSGPEDRELWSEKEVRGYGLFQDDGCEAIATVFQPQWTFSLSTLEPDTLYRFRVEAIDIDGRWTNTGPSTEVLTECATYWENGCPPSWPTESKIEFAMDGADAVIVTWTPALDNREVRSYRLTRDGVIVDPQGGVAVTEYTTEGKVTSHRVPGLEPGSTYEFSVLARDDFGQPVNWVQGPKSSYTVPTSP